MRKQTKAGKNEDVQTNICSNVKHILFVTLFLGSNAESLLVKHLSCIETKMYRL